MSHEFQHYEVDEMRVEIGRLRALLVRAQWGGDAEYCQECENHQWEGHARGCKLAKELNPTKPQAGEEIKP